VSDRRLVDTNLIVRFLVQDHEAYTRAAGKLFDACDRRILTLVVLPAVLAECVFVLESFYRHSRRDIAVALGDLIASPGIEIPDAEVCLDALKRYGRSKCHFVDCMLAAAAAPEGTPVATFDEDLRKFPDVRVKVE
jgi:predicted nucleic-acid-binding protein